MASGYLPTEKLPIYLYFSFGGAVSAPCAYEESWLVGFAASPDLPSLVRVVSWLGASAAACLAASLSDSYGVFTLSTSVKPAGLFALGLVWSM